MRSENQGAEPRHRVPSPTPPAPLSPGPHPAPPALAAPERSGTRTLLFLALLLFLNLQADGLPVGGATPLAYQLRLLPFTLLFLALLLFFLFPARLATRVPPALTRPLLGWRGPLVCALAFLALAFPFFLAESRHYAPFGYHLFPSSAGPLFLLGIVALASQLRQRNSSATRLTLLVLVILSALTALDLQSFPLTVRRSDMLPLLAAANHTLLAGADPYRLYTFPTETVRLTYLPGTLLAYLPATLLHLDLRLINLLVFILLTLALLAATRPEHRLRAAALAATFLLGPYLLYRHDLYTPPHWLTLVAALLLAHARRTRLAAIVFGISVATSQFSWILLPFFLLYLFETEGRRTALLAAALTLLSAAALVAPFLLADPHSFLAGTFGHWGEIGLTARPVNLAFFAAAFLGPAHLQLAQLAALATLFLIALRRHSCRTFAGSLRVMTLALAAFILFNLLVWAYFFLLLELLLLLYLLASDDLLRHPLPSLSASHSKT